MPSTIQFAEPVAQKSIHSSIYSRTQHRKKMSVTQTYFLAHSARSKLSREAARSDHNLRLLVGHANMLDSLMLDLAHAEEEQEQWLNRSISGARQEQAVPHTHITTIQETEAEWDVDSNDDDSDFGEEEQQTFGTQTAVYEIDSDLDEDEDEDEELTLTRTSSRHSPPELSLSGDSDSEDDDADMPASPPSSSPMTMTSKQRQALAAGTPLFEIRDHSLPPAEIILSTMQQPTIIAAY